MTGGDGESNEKRGHTGHIPPLWTDEVTLESFFYLWSGKSVPDGDKRGGGGEEDGESGLDDGEIDDPQYGAGT